MNKKYIMGAFSSLKKAPSIGAFTDFKLIIGVLVFNKFLIPFSSRKNVNTIF